MICKKIGPRSALRGVYARKWAYFGPPVGPARGQKIGEFRYKGWVRAMSEPCKCFLNIVYDLETHFGGLTASKPCVVGLLDDARSYTGVLYNVRNSYVGMSTGRKMCVAERVAWCAA